MIPKVELVLWNKKTFANPLDGTCSVHIDDLMGADEGAKRALTILDIYGFVYVEGVSLDEISTERVINRVFPIQKTFFGELWTISNYDRKHKDSAYVDCKKFTSNQNLR